MSLFLNMPPLLLAAVLAAAFSPASAAGAAGPIVQDPLQLPPSVIPMPASGRAAGAAPTPESADPRRSSDGIFDAGKLNPGPELKRLLKEAAAWRTQRQLERLARKPLPAGAPLEFVVIGDAESGRFFTQRWLFGKSGVFQAQLRSIRGRDADFVVQLGDMVSRGTPDRYHEFLGKLGEPPPDSVYLTVIGNHDRRSPHGSADADLYQALFGQTDYYFERGDARFVALDTSAGRLSAEQLRWLDEVLTTDKIKIVFTHMTPDAIGAWAASGLNRSVGAFNPGAKEFTDIVSRHKVARVYVGHIHGFGVTDFQGVRYVLTGGGGSPLYPASGVERSYHYLTVRIGPEGVTETLCRMDGSSVCVGLPPRAAPAGPR